MILTMTVTISGLKAKKLWKLATRVNNSHDRFEVFNPENSGSDLCVTVVGNEDLSTMLTAPDRSDETTLSLKPEWRPALSALLQNIHRRSPWGMAVTAVNFGDDIKGTEQITMKQLSSLIRLDKLGNGVKYVVKK